MIRSLPFYYRLYSLVGLSLESNSIKLEPQPTPMLILCFSRRPNQQQLCAYYIILPSQGNIRMPPIVSLASELTQSEHRFLTCSVEASFHTISSYEVTPHSLRTSSIAVHSVTVLHDFMARRRRRLASTECRRQVGRSRSYPRNAGSQVRLVVPLSISD